MSSRRTAPDARAAKAELRRRFKATLESLDAAEAARDAEAAADRLLALTEVAGSEALLTCLSFGREIDTWRLSERLAAQGKRIYVPRAEPATRTLTVHRYPCELETLSFGLRQPVASAPALADSSIEATVDVAIVVGLAFDRHGHRLGYGRGYFDRFLAARRIFRVALAFDQQLVDELPAEPHDVRFDVIVTTSGVCRPA